MVYASGVRSEIAYKLLAERGVTTATLAGGTGTWAAEGYDLHTPAACDTRAGWSMQRQVRFTAGSLVLLSLLLGLLVNPALLLIPAGIAGGMVCSALTNTCGMVADLDAALAALRNR